MQMPKAFHQHGIAEKTMIKIYASLMLFNYLRKEMILTKSKRNGGSKR